MRLIELFVALLLGLLTLLSMLWIFGAKKKSVFLALANSITASIALTIFSICFTTSLKLNAFSLYISALFGLGGLGICYFVTTYM